MDPDTIKRLQAFLIATGHATDELVADGELGLQTETSLGSFLDAQFAKLKKE
ncbi:MAG: hypothetical protein WC309_03920 [Candidatus Paceibacterota bacterium]|jgi:hypothetical protein